MQALLSPRLKKNPISSPKYPDRNCAVTRAEVSPGRQADSRPPVLWLSGSGLAAVTTRKRKCPTHNPNYITYISHRSATLVLDTTTSSIPLRWEAVYYQQKNNANTFGVVSLLIVHILPPQGDRTFSCI